jgi:hypothetical protein
MHESRSPAIAAMLSALLPGLGQFYNRQFAKGLLFLAGAAILGWLLMQSGDLATWLNRPPTTVPAGSVRRVAAFGLMLLGLLLLSILDAVRGARQSRIRD